MPSKMVSTFFGPLIIQIVNFKEYCRLMQKAYLFSLQIVIPAANMQTSIGKPESTLLHSL
jgi:hypothetical protein